MTTSIGTIRHFRHLGRPATTQETKVSYYFAETIKAGDIEAAHGRVKAALQEHGFGILTEINLQAT